MSARAVPSSSPAGRGARLGSSEQAPGCVAQGFSARTGWLPLPGISRAQSRSPGLPFPLDFFAARPNAGPPSRCPPVPACLAPPVLVTRRAAAKLDAILAVVVNSAISQTRHRWVAGMDEARPQCKAGRRKWWPRESVKDEGRGPCLHLCSSAVQLDGSQDRQGLSKGCQRPLAPTASRPFNTAKSSTTDAFLTSARPV